MSRHCQQNKCQKPCEKKEQCKPACKEEKKCCRFDSWSSSDSDCEKPKGYKRSYTVTEYVFKQKKHAGARWGHKTRCESSWQSLPDCDGKFHKKQNCKK